MNLKTQRKFIRPVPTSLAEKFSVHLVRRETPIPAIPLANVGPCPVCRTPLMVAIGQHIRFHKECRKEGRRRFGRSNTIVEVEEGGVVKMKQPEPKRDFVPDDIIEDYIGPKK